MRSVIDQRDWRVRLYRVGFAVLTLFAIVVQLTDSSHITNFFSYFTIQSNIIGAIVLLIGGLAVPRESKSWSLVRGGAAMYLGLTGIIYNTLLTGPEIDVQVSYEWINNVFHRVMPIVLVLDLVLIPMAHRIRWRESLVWTLYPLGYLAYSLVRGPVVDWYPYPFIDPREDGGYLQVILFSVVVYLVFVGACWLVTEMSAWRGRQLGTISKT